MPNTSQWIASNNFQWVSENDSQWAGFGFKKRRKITIASSLIDATLTDFPLAIPLSTSAGIGTEDLSDIFAELKFPASDPFYDGTTFDTDRWELTGQSGNVSMSGNALQCLADSGDTSNERQGVLSKFKLDYTEDFDIRVDFEVTAGPATDKWQVAMEAYFWDQAGGSVGGAPTWDTGVLCARVYDSANGGHLFQGVVYEDTVMKTPDRDATSATKGRLRIVYNATTPSITPYHDVGAGWVSHGTFTLTNVDDADALVMVGVQTADTQPTVTAKYNNFHVYEGKVKWPDGEPNRKKIKVTLDDLITQCPVEIEHLDVDGQAGMLHTKIPTIASDVDTDIYLHFDADQPDNDDYVGDTGDVAAQAVWDSNFDAVWHMAQDPDGDAADSILDSTANGNDGTPSGTMTAADLVDGLNGAKAIDFDGTDDRINITDYKAIGGSQNRTSEIVFKVPTMTTTIRRLLSWGDDTTAGQKWHMRLQKSDESPAGALRQEIASANVQDSVGGLDDDDWHYGAATLDGATQGDVSLNVDGVEMTETYTSPGQAVNTDITGRDVKIGSGYGNTWENCDGLIGEVRISDTNRSAAWVKATYHTLFDTLITWGDQEGSWLGTWAYRRKFTIDHTLAEGRLVDFPVALSIDASCGISAADLSGLFTEISTANKKKMAIALGDKVTECFFELENWDSTNSKGIIHTKVPILQFGKDTELYIYYDSAQDENVKAGVPGDAIAANVWDEDFVGVWHLDAINALDSTVNNNDGTASGNTALVDGLNGAKACEFDAASDHIDCGSAAVLDDIQSKTIEAVCYADTNGENTSGRILDKTTSGNAGWTLIMANGNDQAVYIHDASGGQGLWAQDIGITVSYSTWYHLAIRHDLASINNDPFIYLNGVSQALQEVSTPSGSWVSDASANLWIGDRKDDDRCFDGKISEVRISNVVRSEAWLKATYETLFDTFGSWSAEEEAPPMGGDIVVTLEAPAEITYSVPAALVSVTIEAAAPAEITYSVPQALAGVGVDLAAPAEITYSVPAATVIQNLNAIGIMSKPNVTASKPSATATGIRPNATATAKKPSATITAKKPSATATGSGPSATVTAKGD